MIEFVLQKLGLHLFPNKTTNFFKTLVSSTIDYREKNNVKRPDMIELLMEADGGWRFYCLFLILYSVEIY